MLHKRILTTVLASVASISLAHAADLGTAVPPPLAPPPAFSWTGLYIGANVGGSFSNNNSTDYNYYDPLECGNSSCTVGTTTRLGLGSSNQSGVIGGIQAGYNWQANSVVFGIEGDIDWGERTHHHGVFDRENCESAGYSPNGCLAYNESNYGTDLYDHFLSNSSGGGSFGTLRLRLGWAMDRTLLYVTGGLAVGDQGKTSIYDYRIQPIGEYVPDIFVSNNNGVNVGYTVGGGLEYALNDNWSVKLEYLYVNLDRSGSSRFLEWSGPDLGPTPGNIGTITASNRNDSFNVVRVGLNYKFGAPPPRAPVGAAY